MSKRKLQMSKRQKLRCPRCRAVFHDGKRIAAHKCTGGNQ